MKNVEKTSNGEIDSLTCCAVRYKFLAHWEWLLSVVCYGMGCGVVRGKGGELMGVLSVLEIRRIDSQSFRLFSQKGWAEGL
jgi:hypothetical protein